MLATLTLPAFADPPAPAAAPTPTGSITAQLKTSEPILKAWAIHLDKTPGGLYSKPLDATVADGKFTATGLPVPGRYDLRFQTASGLIEGWDANLPHSEYVDEQPLKPEAIKVILKKMTADTFIGFHDEAIVLDVQGNIQNAAVLVTGLRTRPFTTSNGEVSDQVIWRVDRVQWESPDEEEWVPWDKLPYYALHRERFKPTDYDALAITFARHLGGIVLDPAQPHKDLGIILLPRPVRGVHAVNPDGSLTKTITLKRHNVLTDLNVQFQPAPNAPADAANTRPPGGKDKE